MMSSTSFSRSDFNVPTAAWTLGNPERIAILVIVDGVVPAVIAKSWINVRSSLSIRTVILCLLMADNVRRRHTAVKALLDAEGVSVHSSRTRRSSIPHVAGVNYADRAWRHIMGIKNRNIASDANIDLSKINLTSGKRTFYEDFDEAVDVTANNIYGFDEKAGSGATAKTLVNSYMQLKTDGNNEAILIYQASTWTGAREPEMACRIQTYSAVTNVNFQIGWAEAGAISGGVMDVLGNKDWAFLEFGAGAGSSLGTTGGDFVLRSKTFAVAVATTTADDAVAVEASTIYNCSVKITANGGIIAKVGNTTIRKSGAVPSGNTDWQPFVRLANDVGAEAHYDQTLNIDTFFVSEDRS